MGCILSSEKLEDSSPTSAGGGEVYVYVPGFRTPKSLDLRGALQGSISADLASRLHLLRSQVLIASEKNTPKSKRKKAHQGRSQATEPASSSKFCCFFVTWAHCQVGYVRYSYMCAAEKPNLYSSSWMVKPKTECYFFLEVFVDMTSFMITLCKMWFPGVLLEL